MKTSYCESGACESGACESGACESGAYESATYEIGIDEAGRGPMLGRVYAAAVILPSAAILTAAPFNHALMKDSKKFHSEKKIQEAAAYIKANAIAWAVAYSSESVIDEVNIRNATHQAMHKAVQYILAPANAAEPATDVIGQKNPHFLTKPTADILLLVDGNDFPTLYSSEAEPVSHICIEGGDNTYTCIAAASILAKVARDNYIAELCAAEPMLITRYDLLKNKGYGTKKHMDGIKEHGITPYHRKSFGICKQF
jgi:ribonuclease HII